MITCDLSECYRGIDCEDCSRTTQAEDLDDRPEWVKEIRRAVPCVGEQQVGRDAILKTLALIDLAADMAQQIYELQSDLRDHCAMRGSKWHAMGCQVCRLRGCAGKQTDELLDRWERGS